ncbi:MAG TPA: hypothetical protein PLA60_00635 [Candidatus Pacearchaeota archaeon]|nr:hypothetical protein [Candidatus Pacearchaeota archaeon]
MEKNKANLSAKDCKTVQFKSKELKEVEYIFFRLANHLLPDYKKEDSEIQHR